MASHLGAKLRRETLAYIQVSVVWLSESILKASQLYASFIVSISFAVESYSTLPNKPELGTYLLFRTLYCLKAMYSTVCDRHNMKCKLRWWPLHTFWNHINTKSYNNTAHLFVVFLDWPFSGVAAERRLLV